MYCKCKQQHTCRIHTRSDIDRITPNIVEQFGCANHSGGDIAKIKANPGIKWIWFIFWHDASEVSKTASYEIFPSFHFSSVDFTRKSKQHRAQTAFSSRLLPFPRKWDRVRKRFFSWNRCVILKNSVIETLTIASINHKWGRHMVYFLN